MYLSMRSITENNESRLFITDITGAARYKKSRQFTN